MVADGDRRRLPEAGGGLQGRAQGAVAEAVAPHGPARADVDRQGVPGRPGPRRRLLRPAEGRGARPLRRERRGQEHAHQDPVRLLPHRHLPGRDPAERAARPLQEPARGARSTASRSSPRSWRWCPSSPSPRTWCWAASPSARASSTGTAVRRRSGALALVGLDVDPDRKVKELGIGQQQMVEIAKALAKNAEILVLDEPTAALTETDAQRLLRFLAELRARRASRRSTSATASRRSSRSPTASPSCATAARWGPRPPRSSPPTA